MRRVHEMCKSCKEYKLSCKGRSIRPYEEELYCQEVCENGQENNCKDAV